MAPSAHGQKSPQISLLAARSTAKLTVRTNTSSILRQDCSFSVSRLIGVAFHGSIAWTHIAPTRLRLSFKVAGAIEELASRRRHREDDAAKTTLAGPRNLL